MKKHDKKIHRDKNSAKPNKTCCDAEGVNKVKRAGLPRSGRPARFTNNKPHKSLKYTIFEKMGSVYPLFAVIQMVGKRRKGFLGENHTKTGSKKDFQGICLFFQCIINLLRIIVLISISMDKDEVAAFLQ